MKYSIAIEGIDNVGKTSTCERIVQEVIDLGYSARIEPEFGNDYLGSMIRHLVENHWASIPVMSQPMLIAADRVHRYRALINDKSSSFEIIIFDRHLFSTEVYQSIAWQTSIDEMRTYLRHLYCDTYIYPDLTLILDASINTVIERGGDDIHLVQFLKEARKRYQGYATMESVKIIDAKQPFELVMKNCMNIITAKLKAIAPQN